MQTIIKGRSNENKERNTPLLTRGIERRGIDERRIHWR
jgi:hypothetical protein